MYATMGDQCLIKKLGQNKFNHIKLRLLQFLQMLLILIMNTNLPLHLTQATIKCAFLRDKKVILHLKQYHSLEHAETKNIYIYIYFFYLDIYFKAN